MMRRVVIFLFLQFTLFGLFQAEATFRHFETQTVPIDRLFTNLQQRLTKDTNSFELTYDLARLHAMAYSTNLVSVSVINSALPEFNDRPKFYPSGGDAGVPQTISLAISGPARVQALRHLTNAIQLYERAVFLLKESTNDIRYKEWMVLRLELGYAWCLDQSGSRPTALKVYRKVLALAWKHEVTGDSIFNDWVNGTWRPLPFGNNPPLLNADLGEINGLGPGVCISEETIGYLLRLLDPEADSIEIADLKRRQLRLSRGGRSYTPIIVPLEHASVLSDLVDVGAEVRFDLDGSGVQRSWGWITTKAAWLVFDPQGQGRITSGLQMFGNVTFWIFWRDGYAALRSLDNDHDGVLRGDELRGLALWQDLNGNGVSEPGEVRSVTEWGITAISCIGETDASGTVWSPIGVTFGNGQTRPTYDWISPSRPNQ